MLEPKDWENPKLDSGTREQLFRLWIKGKFTEIETRFNSQEEELKKLRNLINDNWGESRKKFAELGKDLFHI